MEVKNKNISGMKKFQIFRNTISAAHFVTNYLKIYFVQIIEEQV